MNKSNSYPKIIFLVSGKRKSGKDFICDKLLERVGAENLVIIRLSAPIKFHWAKMNNLQFSELLGSSEYKENYRKAMIEWGESMRNNDYGYFCKAGIEMVDGAANKPVWVISDARRRTDLKWFHDNYSNASIKNVRIYATEEIRALRGWVFEKGVDDAESECDLDSVDNWDFVFSNDNDDENFQKQFTVLTDMLKNALVE